MFTLQNTQAVTVTLLVWRIIDVPLAAVVLVALGAGIVLAGFPLLIQQWRLRSQLHRHETRPAPPDDAPGSR